MMQTRWARPKNSQKASFLFRHVKLSKRWKHKKERSLTVMGTFNGNYFFWKIIFFAWDFSIQILWASDLLHFHEDKNLAIIRVSATNRRMHSKQIKLILLKPFITLIFEQIFISCWKTDIQERPLKLPTISHFKNKDWIFN